MVSQEFISESELEEHIQLFHSHSKNKKRKIEDEEKDM